MRKEDLREYRHICEELNQLAEERLEWRTRAERSTVSPSKAPVLGGEHDPMPMIADRLAAIRTQADSLVRRLAGAKPRVERAIDR
ncbi:MAG: hypothetical protein FWG72_06830, partial [Oscillospiraceae bacterium]|nr:hypothetical protein [Oscillospiraceae bacterium]